MTPLTLGSHQRSQFVDDLPSFSASVVELIDRLGQLLLPLRPGLAIATLTLLIALTLTFLLPLLTSIVATPLERNWLCHVSHLLSVEMKRALCSEDTPLEEKPNQRVNLRKGEP